MDWKMIKSFMKDFMADSIAYFTGSFLVGLFYYIDGQKEIEIIYPLSILLYIYIIWILYRFLRYKKLYQGLDDMCKINDYGEKFSEEISKKVKYSMNRLHTEYLNQLSDQETKRKKERRFLSLWVHNMKTPVSVTDLILQRMKREEMDISSGVQAVSEENKKLLSGLNTVLDMIRLEEFSKDYVPEQLDLQKELNIIINKNKNLFIYNHVFPKVMMEVDEAIVLSDRKWNELMLNQFISNAVKYSREDDGTSKNVYFKIEKEKDRIILTIQDEGIGIPEHDISKVWEPFFTGENGRKGYLSSGIGLYFCSEVSKLLGHTLKLTSEVGKGTCASISYLAKL